MKFCERCLKEIKSNDDYHEVKLYLGGENVSVKCMHTKCHLDMNKQSAGMLKAVGGLMGQLQGVLGKPKDKEIFIE